MIRALKIAATAILGLAFTSFLMLLAYHLASYALRTHAPRAADAWWWGIRSYALADAGWLAAGLLVSSACALLGIFIAKWLLRDLRRM